MCRGRVDAVLDGGVGLAGADLVDGRPIDRAAARRGDVAAREVVDRAALVGQLDADPAAAGPDGPGRWRVPTDVVTARRPS